MKRTIKIALLLCLSVIASTLMFTACNITDFIPVLEAIIPEETTPSHTWSEWIIIKEANCEEKGLLQHYCTACNYTESKPIDALGHTEVVDKAVPPTCTETGLTEGKHCNLCNNIFTKQEIIPALGGIHNYEDKGVLITPPTAQENGITKHTCSICGSFYTEADCLPISLTLTIDNRAVVCYSSTATENLVIPACFENHDIWYRVTRIDSYAFYSCSQFTSVIIPVSVTTIDDYAFYKCSNLTKIIFEGTIEQWNAINNGSNWNYLTSNYTIYCTDGTIAKDGTVTLN